jgi:hypothetical protein
MATRSTEYPRSRYVASAAVIALHLALLQIAQRVAIQSHEAQAHLQDALVWLRLDRPLQPRRAEQPQRESRDESRADTTRPPAMADESEPVPSSTTPSPPRQIDWRSNASRSAQRVVEGASQERYRSFGPRGPLPPGETQAPSVFGDPPKHESGDLDPDATGDTVVWMNDNCYTELDRPVQTARDWVNEAPGQFARPQIRCLSGVGSGAVDGKLFEHLKKREEPPAPKAGTETNELPERIEQSDGR